MDYKWKAKSLAKQSIPKFYAVSIKTCEYNSVQ